MRARLRKKLARRATVAKLRAVADYAVARRAEDSAPPFTSLEEQQDWIWAMLYAADFEHYRWHGCPIFKNIRWIKTARGPRPAWAEKERR